MESSTWRASQWKYKAYKGRLSSSSGWGWCAQSANGNQDWLKIDLGSVYEICGVASQGSAKTMAEYTRDFKLSMSPDGSGWTVYKDTNNNDMVI